MHLVCGRTGTVLHKTGSAQCDVTLERVHVTIVGLEKQ